jgi:hypothetical protein
MDESIKQQESAAEGFYDFAMLFLKAEKYKVAQHYMRTAIKLDPANIKYHEANKEIADIIDTLKKAGITNPKEFESISLEELFGQTKGIN